MFRNLQYISSQCSLALPSGSMTNMDNTRERISFIFDPRNIEICFCLKILASALSELQWLVQCLREPPVLSLHQKQLLQGAWSLSLLQVSALYLDLPPLALFVVVFSSLISILYLVQVLSRLSTRASSSCSSSARASMSSANRRLVMVLLSSSYYVKTHWTYSV